MKLCFIGLRRGGGGGGGGCTENRAVVKSTFVKTESKEVRVRVKTESKEVRVQVQVQMRRSKQRKKKIIFFKTTYLIIDNLCDTRDGISSILI